MRFSLICFAVFATASCFAESSTGTAGNGATLAIVEGQPILEEELSPLIEGQLRQLRYQEFQARRKALDDLINQKIVAAKAKEKGLTSENFLRQEVDDKLPDPSEVELASYYSRQTNFSNVPFEHVREQLSQNLKREKAERARQEYIRKQRLAANVSVILKAPKVQVAYDPARVLGTAGAPVTIVEFSDFQCPYCRKASATMREILRRYDGRVQIAFRDFPLTQIHPRAERAAEAARCATEQGQFWAYHDRLFAAPDKVSDDDLSQHARALQLDGERFDACLREGRFKARIEEDIKEGTRAGVSGTPGFFINGIFVNGSQPLANLGSIIDAELLALKEERSKDERD